MLPSENEWWIVWGITFAACPCKNGGSRLFEAKQKPGMLSPTVDLSVDKSKFDESTGKLGKKVISWNRFKQTKESLHRAFEDHGAAESDDWFPMSKLIADFNSD